MVSLLLNSVKVYKDKNCNSMNDNAGFLLTCMLMYSKYFDKIFKVTQ